MHLSALIVDISKNSIPYVLRKVVIGHVTRSGRNQDRKSGENRYSFLIPLWFALRQKKIVEKMKPYVRLVYTIQCTYVSEFVNSISNFYDSYSMDTHHISDHHGHVSS